MSREFKVGDRVRIRACDDMEREYGVDDWGDIQARCTFTSSMRLLCGRTATISAIGDSGVVGLYDWSDSAGTGGWEFSIDMLESTEPNYMEQVVKMIGVELGQEFEIESRPYGPYRITRDGLFDREGDPENAMLIGLLTGECKIKQLICSHCGGTKGIVKEGDAMICARCVLNALTKCG